MRFLRPAVIRPQTQKFSPRNPVNGRWQNVECKWVNEFVHDSRRPKLNSIITVQVCLGQVRYVTVQLALTGSWLVTMDSVPVDVAACNLFARKLNLQDTTPLCHNRIGLSDTNLVMWAYWVLTCLLKFSSEKSYFSFKFSFLYFNWCKRNCGLTRC